MISSPIGLSPYLKSSTPATSTNCMLSILGRAGSCRFGSASSWSFWPGTSKSARVGLPGKRNTRFGLAVGHRFSPSAGAASFALLTRGRLRRGDAAYDLHVADAQQLRQHVVP